MPPRPISTFRAVQLMVILTLLAWATQTLFQQWGRSATTQPAFAKTAVIELRQQATAGGRDVRLKDIARWSDEDADLLAPVADTVVGSGMSSATADQVKETLSRAGVNLAAIRISGSTACAISAIERVEPIETDQTVERFDPPATAPALAKVVHVQAQPPATAPAAIVNAGNFVTVTLKVGAAEVQTVMKTLEAGESGSTIRARNEATGTDYEVTLTSETEATCASAVVAPQ